MKELEALTAYMKAHPQLRFWQALRNWAGYNFILVANKGDWSDRTDTFYWKDKP